MLAHRSKSEKHDAAKPLRWDPYEVLEVSRNSTDREIKSAYGRMALRLLELYIWNNFQRHYLWAFYSDKFEVI